MNPVPGIEWEYDFVKQYLSTVKLEEINKLAAQMDHQRQYGGDVECPG